MNQTEHRALARGDTDGDKGFSLIELLIVIAILGILAVVVVLSLGGSTTSAKKEACTADLKTLKTAAAAYYAANKTYPAAEADLVPTYLDELSVSYDVTGADETLTITTDAANPNGCSAP